MRVRKVCACVMVRANPPAIYAAQQMNVRNCARNVFNGVEL